MACISVSSFYIAAVQMAQQSLDADHLVSISQCKCTGGDLKRMSEVIRNKLEWAPGTQPITSLTFIRLFNTMFQAAASQLGLGDLYASMVTVCRVLRSLFMLALNLNFIISSYTIILIHIQEFELLLRLEMIACDGNCSSIRPSEVALVLLCTYMDDALNRLESNAEKNMVNMPGPSSMDEAPTPAQQMLRLVEFAAEIRKMCKVKHEILCIIVNKISTSIHVQILQSTFFLLDLRCKFL